MGQRTLQTTRQELVVVDFAVAVSVDVVDYVGQLDRASLFLLLLQSHFELIDRQVTVAVSVYLRKQLAEVVDVFLR